MVRTAITVVDDDALFRESLAQNLLDAGYAVSDFEAGAQALEALLGGAPADLVILDWRMPVLNGIEVLKRMRARGLGMPVIFLTALTDQIYEEAALATGAVDFVEKSRSFAIVLRRIQLILSGSKAITRPADATGDTLSVGALVLRIGAGRASWKGKAVELTLTEFKMVHHMAARAGEDVPYRALYDVVHGSGFFAGTGPDGYRSNVRTFVKRIRHKFRDVDGGFEQIENYVGFGYRWRVR